MTTPATANDTGLQLIAVQLQTVDTTAWSQAMTLVQGASVQAGSTDALQIPSRGLIAGALVSGSLFDEVAFPDRYLVSNADGTVSTVYPVDPSGNAVIGMETTPGEMLPFQQAKPQNLSAADLTRWNYAGALGWTLQTMATGATFANDSAAATPTIRSGGVLPLGAAIVVAVAVVGLVATVVYLVNSHTENASRINAAKALDMANIQAAAQNYASRIKVFQTTGTMPPPSAVETSSAPMVSQHAQDFWGSFARQVVQPVAQAASTGAKVLIGGGLLYLAYKVATDMPSTDMPSRRKAR